METPASRQAFYALGHSDQELQRLSRQGQALGPFTRQLFEEAGISRGMCVLDVGCGSGDVAFLAADLVGPSGKVIGRSRAKSCRLGQGAREFAGDNKCEFRRRRPSGNGV
jgi:SAM-dependent methyltransferase